MTTQLTYNIKVDGKVDFGFSVDLTFVNARIFLADWLDTEIPITRIVNVNNAEARIGRVDECVGCQNCEVSASHP